MGRNWRPYRVGIYSLGTLYNAEVGKHEAVIRFREGSTPRRRRLGVFTEAEGRTELDRYARFEETVKAAGSQTIGDIWDAYVRDREKDGKLMATFHHNWKALAPRFQNMRVGEITDDICRDYAKQRMDRGQIIEKFDKATGQTTSRRKDVSVGTVWTELLRLRSAINWAAKRNIIDGRPPHVWVPRKPNPREHVMSAEQVVQLLDGCASLHTQVFVTLAITTGARSGAITELTWDRVDFDGWRIDYRLSEQRSNPLSKAAQKRRAEVPMTAEAREVLLHARSKAMTNYVVEWNGQPVLKIRKSFEAARVRAGLPSWVTPHVLRHTVVTWLDEAGIPVERVSKLVAHSRTSITEGHYQHTRVESLRVASSALDGMLKAGRRLSGPKQQPDGAN